MFHTTSEGIVFAVKVNPKARSNQVVGWKENVLAVRIAAVPEKGAANEELERYLSSLLGVGRSNIRVIQGHSSRNKRLCVTGITLESLKQRLS
ncbi:MAG: DUF167 domain-containing protein [Parachlamydia sp.]|nr:DUF167 domain-containing protein [Parachlamydia sp.]